MGEKKMVRSMGEERGSLEENSMGKVYYNGFEEWKGVCKLIRGWGGILGIGKGMF